MLISTPDGIANRYNVNLRRYEPGRLREHTEDLKVSSRRLRRLVYIPLGNLTPMKYLQFERPLFSRHQSEAMQSTGDAEETSVWTGEHGLRSFVHIAIPQK